MEQKPLSLLQEFICRYSKERDLVLDCCMGVGSTGVAALSLQRTFIGFEPDPEAFSVAKD